MQKVVIGLIAFLWLWQIAHAEGNLRLIGEDKMVYPASADATYPVMLQVASTDTANLVELFGWQLACTLRPFGDASGISFKSASKPSTNYVFDAVPNDFLDTTEYDGSTGLPKAPDSMGPCFGFPVRVEELLPLSPVTVPATGVNLLQLELLVSATAKGRFDICILPDPDDAHVGEYFGSAWDTVDGGHWAFEGQVLGGDPLVVGSISIVPEPRSVLLLLSGVVTFIVGVAPINGRFATARGIMLNCYRCYRHLREH